MLDFWHRCFAVHLPIKHGNPSPNIFLILDREKCKEFVVRVRFPLAAMITPPILHSRGTKCGEFVVCPYCEGNLPTKSELLWIHRHINAVQCLRLLCRIPSALHKNGLLCGKAVSCLDGWSGWGLQQYQHFFCFMVIGVILWMFPTMGVPQYLDGINLSINGKSILMDDLPPGPLPWDVVWGHSSCNRCCNAGDSYISEARDGGGMAFWSGSLGSKFDFYGFL